MSGANCDDCVDAEREIESLREYILSHDPAASELCKMAHAFARKMLDKLLDKMLEGYEGWADSDFRDELIDKLGEHVRRAREEGEKGQWVDVANFAAFLDAMEEQ